MLREVRTLYKSRATLEGAGVRLKRGIGWGDPAEFDPFLLLDDIHSENPNDYLAGFPWHPHRGIETVTYVLRGTVEHGDSMGNRGAINSGEIQWMTAGCGIVHQEMPKKYPGDFRGLQLWVNLPREKKLMIPRYRSIDAMEIPEITRADGSKLRVIAGSLDGFGGAARDLVGDPNYWELILAPGGEVEIPVPEDHTVFAYVLEGEGTTGTRKETRLDAETVALFKNGDRIQFLAGDQGFHLLVFTGKPLNEPISWRGPIVMNTDAEIETAFRELSDGTFLGKCPVE